MSGARHKRQSKDPLRILLARRSSMGDIVLTMPTLVALRRGFPDAYIAWMVDSRFREIIEGHDCLNEVISVPRYRHGAIRFLRQTIESIRVLREHKFDMTVDTHGLLKSSAFCLLSGAPRRIGFDDERRELNLLCTNERAPGNPNIHAVDRYLMMAEYLGCPTKPIEFRLPIAEASQNWAVQFVAENQPAPGQPLVGLNLGASRPHKCWPPHYFAQLAEMLYKEDGVVSVLIGSPKERPLSETVQQQVTVPVIDAVGHTTVAQLPALIVQCRVIVSADSGPMHVAVAAGTPVVALFGPTLPHLTGPYGDNNIVLWSQPECACRNKAGCSDYHCMREITVASAQEAVRQLLQANA